jgi:hypothetical protein
MSVQFARIKPVTLKRMARKMFLLDSIEHKPLTSKIMAGNKVSAVFENETNYCTLEDVKNTPEKKQHTNTPLCSKRRKLGLEKVDAFGKLLWESDVVKAS